MYGPPILMKIDRKATKEDIDALERKMDKELKEYKELVKSLSIKRKPYMMNQSDNLNGMEKRNGYPKTENR